MLFRSTLMQELYNVDLNAQREQFMYAGDSPNDAPMFAFFPYSVGMANVRDFDGKMKALPQYITQGHSGSGFSELAERLLALRAAA